MAEQLCPLLEKETEVESTMFSRGPWDIVRCKKTNFVYLANPPAYSELADEFAWEKTSHEEAERRHRDEPIVSRLSLWAIRLKSWLFPKRNKVSSLVCKSIPRRLYKSSLRVLDIGCGKGTLLDNVRQRFLSMGHFMAPLGIEVSPGMAAMAAEKFEQAGGQVIVASAMEGVSDLPDESVDLVVMSCFLEHEQQPRRLLKNLHRVVTGDGAVIVKVPNFASWNRIVRGKKWCGFRYPDHVNYFTPRTLELLASETDFRVERQNLSDKFPLSDNMYAVLKKCA